MSRSIKKHFGGKTLDASDVWWKQSWHQKLRRKVKQLLRRQVENPDEDYVYPLEREVDDLWAAPSDGGSHLQYDSFEHYYREEVKKSHTLWWWRLGRKRPIPTRKEAWKEFIKMYRK